MKCFSLSEINENDTHVVTSFALGSINIWGEQSVEESLTNLCDFDLPLHLYVDIVNNLLRSLRFPDAVAPNYHKISLVRDLMHLDVWHRGHSLVFQFHFGVLFVSYVPNCSTQV
jgi:hypothetical protein